ncbi:DUF1846 domain-containing protein [Entamoeba marina]
MNTKYKKVFGFDTKKYLELQRDSIIEYAAKFNNKLYIEFGGKLLNDSHAVRVLPGYEYNVKVNVLSQLKNKAEILMCINASDIGSKRRRDVQLFYDEQMFKEIEELQKEGLSILGVVVTQYVKNQFVEQFIRRCQNMNLPIFIHNSIQGYPLDTKLVVSDEGFGKNPFIPSTKPIVVVTAPGPGSGKMATCLNQLYHELNLRGIKAGYAKFESFPVWNLPLKHPINVAYEAATTDLNDMNMVDHYYLQDTGNVAVSYNRDMNTFCLLKVLLEMIFGKSLYNSPTQMGVNRIGFAIIDDIIRRYLQAILDEKLGIAKKNEVLRLQQLMKEVEMKKTVPKKTAAAIQLHDGSIIIGKESELMTASSAVIINALKHIAEIHSSIKLLSQQVIESILLLRKQFEKRSSTIIRMNVHETLIALSVSVSVNPTARAALDTLTCLDGCEFHCTHYLEQEEQMTFNRIGILTTSDYD